MQGSQSLAVYTIAVEFVAVMFWFHLLLLCVINLKLSTAEQSIEAVTIPLEQVGTCAIAAQKEQRERSNLTDSVILSYHAILEDTGIFHPAHVMTFLKCALLDEDTKHENGQSIL